jgi:DNA (cytosine-5)-methyltransferase 1
MTGGSNKPVYPDLKLWQEIIFLKNYHAKCKWVIENVKPFYDFLVQPDAQIDRHCFWSNFLIRPAEFEENKIHSTTSNTVRYGFSLKGKKIGQRKDQVIRNLVNPELGLYILEQAQGIIRQEKTNQIKLFNNDAA